MKLITKILSILILPLALLAEDNTIIQVFKDRDANVGEMFLLEDMTLWHTYQEDCSLQVGDLIDRNDIFFHSVGKLENPLEIADIKNYRFACTAQEIENVSETKRGNQTEMNRIPIMSLLTLKNGTLCLLHEAYAEKRPWCREDEIYYWKTSKFILNVSAGTYERYPTWEFTEKQVAKSDKNTILFIGENKTWNIWTNSSITPPVFSKKTTVYCVEEYYSYEVEMAALVLAEQFRDPKFLLDKRLHVRGIVPTISNQIILIWRLEKAS